MSRIGPGAGLFRHARTWCAVLATMAPLAVAAAEKTDIVVLVNGDRITGEIRGVSRGQLDLKTDDAGRLSIEWVKVMRVTSPQQFELVTSRGVRHFSALGAPDDTERGVLRLDDGALLPIPEVVSVVPIYGGLASRLQAYFDLGYSLAKSNEATTLSSDGAVQYRGRYLGTSTEFDLYVQDSANDELKNRATIKETGDLYFGRWTFQTLVQAERNDELNLKLRLAVAAGASYAFLRTSSMELSARGGLGVLRESYTDTAATESIAGIVGGSWNVFHYDSPTLDGELKVDAFPYLSDLGRVRVQGSIRLKYEVIRDFNVGVTFSETFDSRPPDPAAPKVDYTLALTVGWWYRR